ncbi:hypothetical protein Tco_1481999 [Tanacetum coccineum]
MSRKDNTQSISSIFTKAHFSVSIKKETPINAIKIDRTMICTFLIRAYCCSEPCSDLESFEFLGGSRLHFRWTSLHIRGFPYGITSGLYANEHSEVLFVQHRRLDPGRKMGYTIKPPSLMCYVDLSQHKASDSTFSIGFHIPSCYDPVRPDSHHTTLDVSSGYVFLYLSLFTVGNFRLPFNDFLSFKAYEGEPTLPPFRSLCSLGSVGDWLTFQKRRVNSIPFVFKPSTHGLGTFSFPLPLGPFDVVLWSRLLRYPFEIQSFTEPVLYLARLACSWEGYPMHPTILVDGHEMTLRDFLHFPRNRSVTVAAVPDSTPLSVGRFGILAVDLSDEDVEMLATDPADENVEATAPRASSTSMRLWFPHLVARRGEDLSLWGVLSLMFMGRHIGLRDPLASSEETGEVDPFLPGCLDDEARVSHGILSCLPHPKTQKCLDGLTSNELANFHDVSALRFAMSNNMLNREARSLSGEVSRLRDKVVTLRNQRVDFAIMISRLDDMLLGVKGRSSAREDTVVRDLTAENKKLVRDIASLCELSRLVESPKKIIEDDTKSLCSRCRKFKENEVLLLATKASLKADLEEKDVLVSRGQALREVADMGIVLRLEDMRDYEPDAEDIYDKSIDDFY